MYTYRDKGAENMGKKNKKRRHVPVRLNVLFLIVFLLFSALILRLGVVQIVQGEEYEKELTQTANQTARIDAPRGVMYDRYGYTVVDNEMELSVTYTNPTEQSSQTKTQEMLRIANELVDMIEVDTEKITERDRKDYWYENSEEEERKALLDGIDTSDMEPGEEYQEIINQIGDEQLNTISDEELEVIAIYREMTRGYAGSPQRIKRAVTDEEAHKVSENLDKLPGVEILRDSRRSYTYGDTFRNILGNTSTIPAESIDSYLARGYDRSDLVGNSYLEAQYEDVLRGQKAEIERSSTRNGSVTENTVNEKPGSRGNDLVLTIDMEMQQQLEEILESTVRANAGAFIDNREAYAIMMNPQTGEIISMAGYKDDPSNPDAVKVNDTGVVNDQFEMGSSVKAASVLTGFETGVMNPSSVIYDQPLNIKDTPQKSSIGGRSMGNVNYLTALERSSNVYMYYIAMRLAQHEYQAGAPFRDLNAIRDGYEKARYNFNQFGLGVNPGIDLPNVSTGYEGDNRNGGTLMDYFIGQYDTYTPLQMVQYISTIANDGQRMRPHLVSEIREASTNGEDGAIVTQFKPEVLNQLDVDKDEIQLVKNGLRRVVYGQQGTGRHLVNNQGDVPRVQFTDEFPDVAAKTGTAQVTVNGAKGNNQTIVGYAPTDNPQIAFNVVVPGVYARDGNANIVQQITSKMLTSYFEINENREGPEDVDTVLEDVDTDPEVE
ncbi:peptidoglycan D,D-transpeptidase FtsI family protein [Alkalicoccobacillus murimartini]|uniref:serine-type D-Ala-D-Ala carboxypeptidase n=1 Tax=Alkalicoccobacillus murimartini TaxID=171685 RepID=A0ABT9YCK5_9BACI|nr:penicillin-binding protein 2 [Alkalicoccobacillus murimartini]MDQ0205583.1 cell division protein FtsI/penicillin-binding protein 2 [Alkalicoccobacillus murimartini]